MALKIRLARAGAKKRPFYRIVIADARSPRDGRFIERIGSYNPMLAKDHPERLVLNQERAKHWLGAGALPTERVARFLGSAGLVAVPAIATQTKQDQPRAKTQARMKAAQAAAEAGVAAAAAEAGVAAAAAAAEKPAEA